MAAIIKRNGKYQARIRRNGHPSESAIFTKKEDAVQWAMVREAELIKRPVTIRATVRQAIERHAKDVCPGHRGCRWEIVRLTKMLGNGKRPERDALPFLDRYISEVRPQDILAWRDASLKRLSGNSVRREYGLLHSVFVSAQSWGMLSELPFRKGFQPQAGAPRKQRISDDEANAIIAKLGYDRGQKPESDKQFVAAAFLWCNATGMRKGECLSLARSEIVDRVAHLAKTKNGDPRDVPLSAASSAMLELLPKEGRIFPVSSSTCDRLFRKAKREAGLQNIRFHDSRREATTRMASKLDVMTLARVTGHKDLRTLLNTYYAPDMQEVAKLLD